jgi:hypothetical protein
MQAGQWFRQHCRRLFVSIDHLAALTTSSGCEFGVLAKGGTGIHDAPS